MEFEVEFYEDEKGNSPVQKFLGDLRRRQPALHRLTASGISSLMDGRRHGEPLTKSIGNGLFELRVGRKDISRVLWFFTDGQKIILVHGFVKKTNEMPSRHFKIALDRKADYLRRVVRHTGSG